MSIFAYVGFPGSGKSYSVVEQQILPALRQGRTVVTNIPMKTDLVRAEVGGDLRPFSFERALADPNTILEDVPAGCVWVLDEVYKLFPAGMTVAKVPDAFKAILAEHRHRVDAAGNSMQVVFVCQDLAQISAFARQLVETTFRTTKLTALGLHKRYRVDVFNGPVAGANPPVQARLREITGKYDPKVYRYYSSHTLSEAGKEGANEIAIDTRANVFKRPLMIMAPIVIVGLGYFGIHHLWSRGEALTGGGDKTVGQTISAALPGHVAAVGRQLEGGPPPPAVEKSGSQNSYVVKGVVLNEDHPQSSVAYMTGGAGGPLVRPFSACRRLLGAPLECDLEGKWYSESGRVTDDGGHLVGVVAVNDVVSDGSGYKGPPGEYYESWAEKASSLGVPYGEDVKARTVTGGAPVRSGESK